MGPQGPGQHPWDVRCIDATTLARVAHPLPTRIWTRWRHTNFRLPLALQGRVSRLHPKAETGAACHSMPWAPRDPASTLGSCAASMPPRLHVWRTPYPPESGLAGGTPILGYPWHFKGASAACTRRQRLVLHVIACLGPPGTRPAPLGRALHRCHHACTCGAPLTHQNLDSLEAHQFLATLGTSRARQPPAPEGRDWCCMS